MGCKLLYLLAVERPQTTKLSFQTPKRYHPHCTTSRQDNK